MNYRRCEVPVSDPSNVHCPDGTCQRVFGHAGDEHIRYESAAARADGVCFHCRATLGGPHAVLDGKRCFTDCPHVDVTPEIVDQTAGVACDDCNALLAYCWMEHHCSEALWNRAAANRPDEAKPCERDRDDVCFLCETVFDPATGKDFE